MLNSPLDSYTTNEKRGYYERHRIFCEKAKQVMKAAVSKIIPRSMRSTGFGIFETGFGIAWFLGSWLLGALYDIKPLYLVGISMAAQLLAVVFYIACIKAEHE